MFKVFFVEDEMLVRKGVKNNINWGSTNYIFSGDASDGECALPLIRELRPDILITDIKMPFMDGLELSRIVRKEMPWIKIIILSGHDEFYYAREALSIGVSEYLLKPFLANELLEVLDKVSIDIDSDRRRNLVDGKFPFNMDGFLNEKSIEIITSSELILIDFLKLGDKKSMEGFLEDYMELHSKAMVDTPLFYHFALINFIMTITKFYDEIGGNIESSIPRVNEIQKISLTIDSLEGLKKYIESIIRSTIDFRDNKRKDKYGGIISDISLNNVASFVNVSPNHLSSIFSKETGETFIEYVMKIRIRKAKELLKTTGMRSSEIAFYIGYTDPHYFSYIFKKMEKCTPNEFRNK